MLVSPSRAIFPTLLMTVLVSIFKVSFCSIVPKIITNSNHTLRDPPIQQLHEWSLVYSSLLTSVILDGLMGALAHPVSPRWSCMYIIRNMCIVLRLWPQYSLLLSLSMVLPCSLLKSSRALSENHKRHIQSHNINIVLFFILQADYNLTNKIYRWLSARLQYLQCVSNGDTAVLH